MAEIALRRKYRDVSNSSQKTKGSGTSGTSKSKPPAVKGEKEAAMAVTRANQRILVLVDGRHRRFMRLSEVM